MRPSRRVLVVSRSAQERDLLLGWLQSVGADLSPIVVGDFQEARAQIETSAPDLIVSDVKLGAYNGLHLVISARGLGLRSKSILIGDEDVVLRKEAEREGATYLVTPVRQDVFCAAAIALLPAVRTPRRLARKRVAVDAIVAGIHVSLVDLSYEGLRLEVPDPGGITLPPFFTVHVQRFNVECRVKNVWTLLPEGRDVLMCGAALPAFHAPNESWRHLVDAVPGIYDAAPEVNAGKVT
jgi:CheY-like chemotaxis protein